MNPGLTFGTYASLLFIRLFTGFFMLGIEIYVVSRWDASFSRVTSTHSVMLAFLVNSSRHSC